MLTTFNSGRCISYELADHDPGSDEGKVDMLIGSDLYWEVVIGEIMRDQVALNSKFGWILLGPVKHGRDQQGFTTASLVLQGSEAADDSQNFCNRDYRN